MFIKNERTMEDFIQADESFNKYIEDIYSLKNVKLAGRQVHVGDGNIIDLLYKGYGNATHNDKTKCLVIVELKFRELEMVDLAQIGRYACVLRAQLLKTINRRKHQNFEVYTILVGTGITLDFAHFMNGGLYDDDYFKVMRIKTDVIYEDVTDKLWACEDLSGKVEPCVDEFANGLIDNGGDDGEQRN